MKRQGRSRLLRLTLGIMLIVLLWPATFSYAKPLESKQESHNSNHTRVLIDLSHCQNGGGALDRGLFRRICAQVTINYGPLSLEVLRNYDVVFITGSGPRSGPSGPGPDLPFTDGEIDAVHRFVREGGGLLVAAHGNLWHNCHQRPMSEMARNQLLRDCGIAFTADVARGNLLAAVHPALAEADPQVLRRLMGDLPSPLVLMSRQFTKLIQTTDGATIAVAGVVDKGRLIVLGAETWAVLLDIGRDRSNLTLVDGFVAWLGQDRYSVGAGAPTIPDQIDPPVLVREAGFTISGLPALRSRAEAVAGWCQSIRQELESYLGVECLSAFDIRLLVGDQGGWSGGGHIGVCAFATDLGLIGILGHEMGHSFWEPTAPPAWFNEALACLVGLRAQKRILGRADEEWAALRKRQWREADPDGRQLDLTVYPGVFVPPSHTGKGVWVISELERKYGPDFIARFEQIVRTDRRAHKLMSTDELVYFLGRAAGTDLTPWFRAIGTTVTRDDPFATGSAR